jgi:hypothetical protein
MPPVTGMYVAIDPLIACGGQAIGSGSDLRH